MTVNFKLDKLPQSIDGPLLLVILDGVGIYLGSKDGYPGNALDLAQAPCLKETLPRVSSVNTKLKAHGQAVGMPSDDDMGNSEVGHNAMGAGRVFDQGAKLVQNAVNDRSLFQSPVWKEYIGTKKEPGLALEKDAERAVHFIGLLSDGNVHSHIDHLIAMIEECSREGVRRVFVHALLDGRDVDKESAQVYISRLEERLQALVPASGRYAIASGGGRMKVTMDRYEASWDMVELGWKTHVRGEGRFFPSALDAVETLRGEKPGIIDQDLPPFVIGAGEKPVGPVQDDDIVIFFNFRGDRAIEISRAFAESDFDIFPRRPEVRVHYAGMLEYDGDLGIPPRYLINPPAINRTLSEYLVKNGVPQYAISETQKFGHVTYFWNGNNSEKFDPELETWKEIPSDQGPFNESPRMKADEVTDELISAMESGRYRFLRVNYANGDMVGHTGDLDAAVEAMEAVDQNLARLLEAAERLGVTCIITADHGNCDQMFEVDKQGRARTNEKGEFRVKTSHTLNPVPFFLCGPEARKYDLNPEAKDPGLANLAATIMHLLGFQPPEDYCPSLVRLRS